MSDKNVPQQWTWIDRAANGWPSGPWDGEPDKMHWKDEATGLDCLAVRNPRLGHWCGYVAVAEGHPMFGKSMNYEDDFDFEVHGGITFADFCQETESEDRGVCHVPYPGDPDRVWWLGFDCAHGWDSSPSDAKYADEHGHPFTREDENYKSIGYVRAECRSLAAQLAKEQTP